MSQFFRNSSGSGGGGDVVGPGSSIDGDIAVFSGTTGKLLQDIGLSSTTPSFSGTVTTGGNLVIPNTNAGGTAGEIVQNGIRTFSNFGTNNIFVGANSGNTTNTGTNNTGGGVNCFNALTNGDNNSGYGENCLAALQSGSSCCGFGQSCLADLTSGDENVGYGRLSLTHLLTGTSNTAFGYSAGSNYNAAESNNLCIGFNVQGTSGESNTIRIGNPSNSAAFIAGINGVTVVGTAVLCDVNGQLGTVVSSKRYKENIQDMDDSVSVLNLRPVQFNYIHDELKTVKYGLIAEEIHQNFPHLCFYNDKSEPESVLYHELPIFLLKEIQKLNKRIEILEGKNG